MTQNANISVSGIYRFCKKNSWKENLDFLRDDCIAFVEKIDNPPKAPQIRQLKIIGASLKW